MGLRIAPAVADLDTLRLGTPSSWSAGRHRTSSNRVFDYLEHESSTTSLRIAAGRSGGQTCTGARRRSPSVHPDGYKGPGLGLRDSQLREGYRPTENRPPERYVPSESRELNRGPMPPAGYAPPPAGYRRPAGVMPPAGYAPPPGYAAAGGGHAAGRVCAAGGGQPCAGDHVAACGRDCGRREADDGGTHVRARRRSAAAAAADRCAGSICAADRPRAPARCAGGRWGRESVVVSRAGRRAASAVEGPGPKAGRPGPAAATEAWAVAVLLEGLTRGRRTEGKVGHGSPAAEDRRRVDAGGPGGRGRGGGAPRGHAASRAGQGSLPPARL